MNGLLWRAGFELKPRPVGETFPHDFDAEERAMCDQVLGFTMQTPHRIQALVDAVRYLVRARIPGAFVECGVYRGGSMVVVATMLARLAAADRDLWLYDTFEGMSAPGPEDATAGGIDAAIKYRETARADGGSDWCRGPLEEVQKNLFATSYARDRIRFIKGKVEDTIPGQVPEQIALLRLDTDFYESTAHEMRELYPRLAPGGVLIIDDYGKWKGARKAVDEYLAKIDVPLFLHRIDTTARIAVKPRQG